ncbi:MAG: MBL fold metallo-hydrolase [Lachnospiraceae bacterium]
MSDFRIETLHLGMVQTNCYLVWNDDSREAFVVDPADKAEVIAMKLKQNQLILKAILLTHGHFDHMLAVPELKKLFHVPVYAGEKERPVLLDANTNLSGSWINRPVTFEADHYVKEGDVLHLCDFTLRVIETPGHTCGGVCYLMKEEPVLFAGDTIFKGSYGRTDLETGNADQLARSIREKVLVLPPETVVCPGHNELTNIAVERVYNPMARGMKF